MSFLEVADFVFESMQACLRAVFFVALVYLIRDLFQSLLFPKILLARGIAGSQQPGRALVSKWIISLGRLEFYFARDWIWLVILALNTSLIAMLPLTGESFVKSQRLSMVILTIFSLEVLSIIYTWWRHAPAVGVSSFLKFANRALIALAVLTILFGYLGFVIGTESLSRVLHTPLILGNPTSILALICALILSQTLSLEAPLRAEGWGIHHVVKIFYEIFWMALLVIIFLGSISNDPVFTFLELVFKTALLVLVCDGVKLFLPSMRGAFVERTSLYLLVPFGIILVLSFWLRSVL